MQQSTAAALLLKGLPWKRAAAPSLAAVSALTHLVCHGSAPPEERCLAFAQLAQHAAEHRGCRAAEQVLPIPHVLHSIAFSCDCATLQQMSFRFQVLSQVLQLANVWKPLASLSLQGMTCQVCLGQQSGEAVKTLLMLQLL